MSIEKLINISKTDVISFKSFQDEIIDFSSTVDIGKIYGDNYMKILMVDPDKVSFKELYQNNYIISEYKEILLKLDEICER